MSRHRIFFVATLLLFLSLTLALTFDRPLVSAALAAESGTTQAAGAGTIFWTDSIQAGASPWGLPLGCAHPISTPVPCSDANGANVSVVPDPAGGPGKAMRHYMDVSNGGGRAQAGTMTFMKSGNGCAFCYPQRYLDRGRGLYSYELRIDRGRSVDIDYGFPLCWRQSLAYGSRSFHVFEREWLRCG